MEILVLGVLILINGFFALSEIALVSSKKARLEQMKVEGSYGAQFALKLLNDSERFLSAIQVGITLIGIVTGVYSGANIADDVMPFFQKFEFTRLYAHEISLTLTVLIITYTSIVIGELVPKTIALSNPEKIARKVAPVIFYFSGAFYPFVKLLSFSTSFINQLLGIKKYSEQITETELRQMIKIASNEGVIEKEQNIIHEKVFYFSDKRARHIMTHRTDVEWLDIDKPEQELRTILMNVNHSKLICSKGSLDNFQGILFLKDYYKTISGGKNVSISELLVQPLIIPENTYAQKLLDLLRKNKVQICFVVNEYGGFEGIVTIHDILESIVGHIPDEKETDEPDVFVRDDKSVLVSGDAPLETLADVMENFLIDFEKIDYSTVAGYVFNQINKMPELGDKFRYQDYEIEIIDVDGNKIDKILITRLD